MKRIALWIAPLVAIALVGMISVAKADDAKDAKKGTLNVTVTDADGKPVSGATVKVFPPMAHEKKAEKQAADAGTGSDTEKKHPDPVATGTTDDKGVAKIDVDPGDYSVVANLKGKGRGMAKATAKAGESADVAITIKPGQKKNAPAAAQ